MSHRLTASVPYGQTIMSEPTLLLSESAFAAMRTAADAAHPLESGGILVGVYVDGRPWVTRAIELASTDRGHNHYRIPGDATQPAVKAARAEDSRLGYLGDWHSHPADSGPSPTDLASLALVSYRRPRRPNPTMVVIRRRADQYVLDARRTVGIHLRVCDVRLAGDLPNQENP